MSRWFRHYAGMMRDEKLVRVAVKSKQPVERVVWVWGAILESAAEINDGGRYELDSGEVAYFLRADEVDICAVERGLSDAGHVAENAVVKWRDRQHESDTSAERQRRYRDRQRRENNVDNEERDGHVTLRSGVVIDFDRLYRPGEERDRPPSHQWADIRARIFERDDFTCQYCGDRGRRLECDHIVPVARGGGHEDANLTTACFPCNRSKRDKLVTEWQQ